MKLEMGFAFIHCFEKTTGSLPQCCYSKDCRGNKSWKKVNQDLKSQLEFCLSLQMMDQRVDVEVMDTLDDGEEGKGEGGHGQRRKTSDSAKTVLHAVRGGLQGPGQRQQTSDEQIQDDHSLR